MEISLQDKLPGQCFGCGPHNAQGLQIKSFWLGDEAVCAWRAQPWHIGHPGILCGGILASVVDCHCIWTAVAQAHRAMGIEPASDPTIRFVTAQLSVSFRRPVPIEHAIELRARVTDAGERKSLVQCRVVCAGALVAEAELIAVRVREAAQPQSPTREQRYAI